MVSLAITPPLLSLPTTFRFSSSSSSTGCSCSCSRSAALPVVLSVGLVGKGKGALVGGRLGRVRVVEGVRRMRIEGSNRDEVAAPLLDEVVVEASPKPRRIALFVEPSPFA